MRNVRLLPLMLFLLFTGSAGLKGQQHPFFSQYMLDKFLVNPAVAGANGMTTVNLISRQQYVGFENFPQSFAVNAQSRLLDDSYILRMLKIRKKKEKKSRSGRVGIGGSLYADRNGIVSRTGFQGTYAYHINFKNSWQFSGGLSIQGYQFRVDDADVFYNDPGDPLLNVSKKTFFVPDASAGIFITNGSLYGGVTLTDLLASKLKLGQEIYANYETYRSYNILAGYRIDLSSKVSLEPSFLLQGSKSNLALDINTKLYYLENYWAGVSYRSNNSMVVMVGARFDAFYLGYAYDIDVGPVRTYSSGSHEVILGIRIGENSVRRFRWFRQDQRNFDI